MHSVYMKEKNIAVQLLKEAFRKPIFIVCFSIVSQLFIGFFVVFLSSADINERKHGGQASLSPPDAIVLLGQSVYYQEGCQYCHTQSFRPLDWELKRFSDPEKLGYFLKPSVLENYYEAPSLRGSRRIGPDLSRVASLYDTEDTLKALLKGNATQKLRKLFHSYQHLFEKENKIDIRDFSWKIRMMLQLNIPFSDAYQRSAASLPDMSRGDMLVAYLLSRGKKQIQFQGKYYRKD